ncbi:MAG: hypothetical protein Q7S22_00540 [Candidatus Micrarchaeota archaeon]|nr:hypothetical protein [Candidatus Micrarchaeota archaeon]
MEPIKLRAIQVVKEKHVSELTINRLRLNKIRKLKPDCEGIREVVRAAVLSDMTFAINVNYKPDLVGSYPVRFGDAVKEEQAKLFSHLEGKRKIYRKLHLTAIAAPLFYSPFSTLDYIIETMKFLAGSYYGLPVVAGFYLIKLHPEFLQSLGEDKKYLILRNVVLSAIASLTLILSGIKDIVELISIRKKINAAVVSIMGRFDALWEGESSAFVLKDKIIRTSEESLEFYKELTKKISDYLYLCERLKKADADLLGHRFSERITDLITLRSINALLSSLEKDPSLDIVKMAGEFPVSNDSKVDVGSFAHIIREFEKIQNEGAQNSG